MPESNEFVNYLLDLLEPFGMVSARSMFGGYGIYRDGLMFGLVADDALYLKVDDVCRSDFEAVGSEAFTYYKLGKPMQMAYYSTPPETLESREEMLQWAEIAWQAALRSKRK